MKTTAILDILEHNNYEVCFHGLHAANLWHVVNVSNGIGDGSIHLYGRSHADVEAEDAVLEHVLDGGVLYTTTWQNIELSINEFVGDGALLVLGAKAGVQPHLEHQGHRDREQIVRLEEWEVIGAIKLPDEDDFDIDAVEEIDFYSVAEIVNGDLC